MASSDCLLARAISLPDKAKPKDSIDSLAAQFDASLALAKKPEKPAEEKGQRKKRVEEIISPADHLALQSLRSSALARKTNTTTKFSRDCRNLFADLLIGPGEKAAEEAKVGEEEEEGEKDAAKEGADENGAKGEEGKGDGKAEGQDGELIPRGPIRANFIGHAPHLFHPYVASQAPLAPFNAAAPQSTVIDQSSLNPMAPYGYSYECGLASNWSCSGWGGRDSVLSSPSSTPDSTGADMAQLMMSPGGRSELPDDLSDFILEYSRRYSPVLSRKGSYSDGGSPRSSIADSPCGTGGGGESPLSAPQSSPSAPRGGAFAGPLTPGHQTMFKQASTDRHRPAKEKLRALIRNEDMDDALAWTCKCIQRHPGALTFQDGDSDTLLHIVTSHMDLAKIYALVEQMLKLDVRPGDLLPFDMPNGVGETPLMVAVQKRHCEVVEYLLEAGATPNAQSSRAGRDSTPLHFAATRGMSAIVRAICADPRTDLNAQNRMGMSPLLCAFKSHGELEEESQSRVCNLKAAEELLKAGADPMQRDVSNGRSMVHYAVERMDEKLIELLRSHLDTQKMGQLANQEDFSGETPMHTLEGLGLESEELQAALHSALARAGAK